MPTQIGHIRRGDTLTARPLRACRSERDPASQACGALRRTDRSLTFAPLRIRSFRFQWPADVFTSWAFEMETLILGTSM